MNVLMFGIMGIVVLFFDFREFGRREAYRKWKNNAVYYTWRIIKALSRSTGNFIQS